MLNVTLLWPWQTLAGPVILLPAELGRGLIVTARVEVPLVPQELLAETVTAPLTEPFGYSAAIEVGDGKAAVSAPGGQVQV